MESNTAAPSLFNILRPDLDPSAAPMEEGDCAIILKRDGGFKIVSTGDVTRLTNDPSTWTEADHAMFAMGQKLMALALACTHEQVMAMLLTLAADPEVLDPAKLAQVARPN